MSVVSSLKVKAQALGMKTASSATTKVQTLIKALGKGGK